MAWNASRTIGAAGAMALVALSGCGAFRSHRQSLERLHASGHYDEAAVVLDDEDSDLYRRERLLWRLDRGAVALALNDDDGAIEHLEVAERIIDAKREQSADETVGVWLVSERAAPYLVEPFEELYVNVLKLLAQLEAGRIDGHATVEARRLAWKADHLRDLHEAWADELDRRAKKVGTSTSMKDVEYIESPLGTYLSAITFMEADEPELQGVAARRLQDTIMREQGLIGAVDGADFADLESLTPDDADLLVVALSGRGPTKRAESVGPIVIYTVPIYFELPKMSQHASAVSSVVVEIDGVGERELSLIENMSMVATENHERHLPLIRARTVIRATAKATGTAIAARAAGQNSGDAGALATVAVVLGGLAYMMASEKADLRSWVFLPGQAHVATLNLPAGEHRVRTVYQGAGGGTVYATPWRDIEVRERGLKTIVEHYWR